MLLLTDVPEASTNKLFLHPVIQHNKGLVKSYAFFAGDRISVVGQSPLADILDINPVHELESSGSDWGIDTKQVYTQRYYPKVVEAYAAARKARFEHGERGVRTV